MKWEKIMTLRQSQAVKIITQCETIEYLFLISREQLKIRNFWDVIIFALPRNVFDRVSLEYQLEYLQCKCAILLSKGKT